MPLQDLTPQLRTRLNRMERTVGWFVMFAALILLAGFVWYLYTTAERKGWFVVKLNYATGMNNASGLKTGDPVKLLGFDVGEITFIEPNPPTATRGVQIVFNIRKPYYDYIWLDSTVRLVSDFLGHTYLEVVQGKNGAPTAFDEGGKLFVMDRAKSWVKYKSLTNEIASANSALNPREVAVEATNQIDLLLKTNHDYYIPLRESKYDQAPDRALTNWIYVPLQDSPSLSDRLDALARKIETALPNILYMTNELNAVLTNANASVLRLNATLAKTDPILTNVTTITENLRSPKGSLGEWIIPTNLNAQLQKTLESAQGTLKSAHTTLDDTDTNITMLAADLDKTLIHLASVTSNLNSQIEVNTNLISDIDRTIAHTDGLIQGLKRHWFLRSAFKKKPAAASK